MDANPPPQRRDRRAARNAFDAAAAERARRPRGTCPTRRRAARARAKRRPQQPEKSASPKHATRVLDELSKHEDVIYIGEDVEHGGYYLVSEASWHGGACAISARRMGAGGAAGLAQCGLVPIVEVPYAKYLDCGFDQFAEIAVMHWLSAGGSPRHGDSHAGLRLGLLAATFIRTTGCLYYGLTGGDVDWAGLRAAMRTPWQARAAAWSRWSTPVSAEPAHDGRDVVRTPRRRARLRRRPGAAGRQRRRSQSSLRHMGNWRRRGASGAEATRRQCCFGCVRAAVPDVVGRWSHDRPRSVRRRRLRRPLQAEPVPAHAGGVGTAGDGRASATMAPRGGPADLQPAGPRPRHLSAGDVAGRWRPSSRCCH